MLKWLKDVLGINKYAIDWVIRSVDDPSIYERHTFNGALGSGMFLTQAKYVLYQAEKRKYPGAEVTHEIVPFKRHDS